MALPSVSQLLLKPKFSSVEKIKTIGSTYMAAAGLSGPSGQENQVCSQSGGLESQPAKVKPNSPQTCHFNGGPSQALTCEGGSAVWAQVRGPPPQEPLAANGLSCGPAGWKGRSGCSERPPNPVEAGRRAVTRRGPTDSALSRRTWSGSAPTLASWWSSA